MSVSNQIADYINNLPEVKRGDVETIHNKILNALPGCKLWFEDGKDASGKTVANPSIGYGSYTIKYADGKSREFYQAGVSANTSGITVYIMGLPDRKYLPETYSLTIGKATVSAYCIKFKALTDVDMDVLMTAIKDGVAQSADRF